MSQTRGEFLRASLAVGATPFLGSPPRQADPGLAKRPLRVSTIGIEWPDDVHRQAQLDLGFPITLVPLSPVQQIGAALAKPDSFDVFGGYGYQAMRVWFSGHLRPIDTHRITAWRDFYKLFAWGKL